MALCVDLVRGTHCACSSLEISRQQQPDTSWQVRGSEVHSLPAAHLGQGREDLTYENEYFALDLRL